MTNRFIQTLIKLRLEGKLSSFGIKGLTSSQASVRYEIIDALGWNIKMKETPWLVDLFEAMREVETNRTICSLLDAVLRLE